MKSSVLICNYNNERFIRACVDSALNQTKQADEIIVYDDDSDDASLKILKKYGDRIRLIKGKVEHREYPNNHYMAVDRLIEESSGDILFMLDGDDEFHPNKVEEFLEVFENSDVDLVQTPMLHIDADGRHISVEVRDLAHREDDFARPYNWGKVDHSYQMSSLAFRRSFLQSYLPLRRSRFKRLRVDVQLSIYAIADGKVVALDQPLARYRIHDQNRSKYWDNKYEKFMLGVEKLKFFNQYSSRKIPLYRFVKRSLLGRFMRK